MKFQPSYTLILGGTQFGIFSYESQVQIRLIK